MRFQVAQQVLGRGVAEVTGAPVPGKSFRLIAGLSADAGAVEKGGIESRSHPQRRAPIACFDGERIKKACRHEVAHAHKCIAARNKCGNFCRGEASFDRCR